MIGGVRVIGVLIAMIAHQILGALWYSPLLFGNTWMKAMKKNPDDQSMQKGYLLEFAFSALGALITAYFLGYIQTFLEMSNLLQAVGIGLIACIGFISSNRLIHAPFEGQSRLLLLISHGFDFVSYTAISIVLYYFG